jgi:hypothetical protein
MADPQLITFRDSLRRLSPPWLQNGIAQKVLYAMGLHVDAFGDALVAGVKQRLPNVYSDESLPLLGRDRRISRGRNEFTANYAKRLTRWLADHRRRGGPYALLSQLFGFYAAAPFALELVYVSGRRYSLDTAGNITRDDIAPRSLADPAKWAQWWLFFHWPTLVPDDGTWGDPGDWGDGGVWGSSLTGDEVSEIRLVPTTWNAAHPFGTIVLLHDPDSLLWGYPIRTWGSGWHWAGVGGPARINVR